MWRAPIASTDGYKYDFVIKEPGHVHFLFILPP